MKRNKVKDIVNSISKEDRKLLRQLGIKIGSYHIFLPKMLKPKAVNLRIALWKFYNNVVNDYKIPKSGLNFLVDDNLSFNSKFLLFVGLKSLKTFM